MTSPTKVSVPSNFLGTNHTLFEPKKFAINEQLLYCTGSIIPSNTGAACFGSNFQKYELPTVERKLVKQCLVQHVLASNKIQPFVTIDRTRVVLKTSKTVPLSVMRDQEQYSALVITWNGLGNPPKNLRIGDNQKQSLAFKRVYNDKSAAAQQVRLRFHWSSVNLVKDDVPQLSRLWNQLAAQCNSREFVIHRVSVVLKTTLFTLPQMLAQARGADPVTARRSYEVVQALLQNEHGSSEDVTVHGHHSFDRRVSTSMLGLEHISGQTRKLSLNASDPPLPIMSHGATAKLFLPESSVADFLIENHGGVENVKLLSASNLEQVLRGKSIRFRTASGHVVKPIRHVSILTPNTITNRDDMHPFWRSKTNPSIRFPDLPCIDVGSGQSVLLPLEVCSFLPSQSFKQTTPAIFHAFATQQKLSADLGLEEIEVGQARISLPQNDESKQERREKLNIAVLEAYSGGGIIHFAEAGVSGLKSAHWDQFMASFGDLMSLRHMRGMPDKCTAPMVLQFQPCEDSAAIWRQQLVSWKGTHCKTGEKAVLFVAVRSDQHQSQIYRTIKFLADVEVGIEVYFVNIETLEQKVERNSEKGVEMAVKEVLRRMMMRNPPTPPITCDVVRDIAVSIHVGQVNVDVAEIDKHGRCTKRTQTLHLLVFASRHMEESTAYNTTCELVAGQDLTAEKLSTRLSNFLEAGEPNTTINKNRLHHVTILRSGLIPSLPRSATTRTDTVISPSECLCQGYLADYERKELFNHETYDQALPASRNDVINNEVAALRGAVQKAYGSASSTSYILLNHDKDFAFSETAKGLIAADVSKVIGSGPLSRFFITDRSLNPDQHTLVAHRQVHPKDNASMINLTLLGDPLIVKPPRRTSRITTRELFRDWASSSSDGDGDSLKIGLRRVDSSTTLVGQYDTSGMKPGQYGISAPSPKISDGDLQCIAKLWVDDRLGLYDTKWPIPTHLALLACKRAQMHVRKIDGVSSDHGTAGYELRPVHKDVEGQLYYL